MTEPPDEPRKEPAPVAAAPGWRTVAITLAVALLLVVGLAATAVLWLYGQSWTPPMPPPDPRLDRLEAAQQQSRQQSQQAEAAATAALQRLDQRVAALEASPAVPASEIAELRQQVARLAGAEADLAARIETVDKAVRAQATGDPTDIALLLALLQIRDAIEAGRPFAAAYEALAALAQARPEIAAAATSLSAPATTGLAGRPVLANRLRELADAIAAESTPASTDAAAPDWADRVWRRMSGLVTIRRIDSAGLGQDGGGAAAVVNAALQALAGGDLEGAVGALDKLTGAPAETAGPWLRMARERLAAETALQKIEALLVARLGAPPNPRAGSRQPR